MTRESSAGTAAATATSLVFAHLHTYFLFPFALDKDAIQADHPQAWAGRTRWIDGLDSWIAGESGRRGPRGIAALGPWKRSSYSTYDLDSPAYSDLLFFHPVVRYVFFDTGLGRHADNQQNQLRCYTIDLNPHARLWLEGSDRLGRGARAEVKDLRLYLSAQGIGLLSIGIRAEEIDADKAIWINRRLRKLYPVDSSSIPQGRSPDWIALRLESESGLETVCEERFEHPAMVGFYPPLPNTIKSLLYFADYALEEYEPILDENMFVYSYGELDADRADDCESSERVQALLRNFQYLGHKHADASKQRYGRATVHFGFTAHSCSVLALESKAAEALGFEDQPNAPVPMALAHDDLEICRTFHTRYYLMTVVALFYRAVLLDFTERSALISRMLLEDQQSGRLTLSSITHVNELRAQFLNFSSYWHFEDLTCKQTDNDLFRRLCGEYNIDKMKQALEDELSHMGDFVYTYYQLRNTEAVNRLAVLSLIFGGGAVLTGFFGMNFGREFGKIVFEGEGLAPFLHYFLVILVSLVVFGSLAFGTFLVVRNWRDYLAILQSPKKAAQGASLKRDG